MNHAMKYGAVASQAGGPMLPGWDHTMEITIPANLIDAELTNHPVPVYLNNSNFDFSKCKPDGSDIRFTDKNLNFLKFERKDYYIENQLWLYDEGKEFTEVTGGWLQRPHPSGTAYGSTIYAKNADHLYYKNTSTTTTGYDAGFKTSNNISTSGYDRLNIECAINKTDTYDRHIVRIGSTNNFGAFNAGTWERQVFSYTITGTLSGALETALATVINGKYSEVRVYRVWLSKSTDPVAKPRLTYNILLPKISDLVDTKFYMHYGNPNAFNTSVEAWQDQTGKQLTYNGNVKLVPITDAMRIATSTTGTDRCYFDVVGVVNSSKTVVAEWELKLESSGSVFSQSLVVKNGTKQAFIAVNSSYIICNYGAALAYIYNMNTITDYHVYKIELQGTTQTKFYVDGMLIWTETYSNLSNNGTNSILFGDVDTVANYGGSAIYKNIKYNLDYIGNPTVFVEWTPTSLPSSQGWTAGGTASLATLITENYTGRNAYFDGSGDYFSLPNNIPDFNFLHQVATWKWTAEFYIKPNSFSYRQILLNTGGASTSSHGIFAYIHIDRSIRLSIYNGTSNFVIDHVPGATYPNDTNTPHKIEIDYDHSLASNNVKVYVDGVLVSQGTKSGVVPSVGNCTTPYVGYDGSSVCSNKYLLGMRLTKGKCRNAENFVMDAPYEIDGPDVVFCSNFDTIYDQNYAMVQHMGDTLVDATGNGNNGTATGTTVVNTDFGKARNFNGSSDYLRIPQAGVKPSQITLLALVIRPNWQASGRRAIMSISQSGGYKVCMNDSWLGRLEAHIYSNSSNSATSTYLSEITDGWHVVSAKYDSRYNKLFLDGNLKSNHDKGGTYNIQYPITVLDLLLGAEPGTTNVEGDHFDGQQSGVRISSIARSDAWIKAESLGLKSLLLTRKNL